MSPSKSTRKHPWVCAWRSACDFASRTSISSCARSSFVMARDRRIVACHCRGVLRNCCACSTLLPRKRCAAARYSHSAARSGSQGHPHHHDLSARGRADWLPPAQPARPAGPGRRIDRRRGRPAVHSRCAAMGPRRQQWPKSTGSHKHRAPRRSPSATTRTEQDSSSQ